MRMTFAAFVTVGLSCAAAGLFGSQAKSVKSESRAIDKSVEFSGFAKVGRGESTTIQFLWHNVPGGRGPTFHVTQNPGLTTRQKRQWMASPPFKLDGVTVSFVPKETESIRDAVWAAQLPTSKTAVHGYSQPVALRISAPRKQPAVAVRSDPMMPRVNN